MRKVSVTRMELLAHTSQLELARRGRDLLEKKRAALMKELMNIAGAALQSSYLLQNAAQDARLALSRAEAMAGTDAVQAAALATRAELPLEVETVWIVGLKVPRIELKRVFRSMLSRGYSVTGESTTIDETAASYEAEVDAILQLAEIELRLKRLAVEVQRTSRRLNALDNELIPQLVAEINHIKIALDERERADYTRLKRVRRILKRV